MKALIMEGRRRERGQGKKKINETFKKEYILLVPVDYVTSPPDFLTALLYSEPQFVYFYIGIGYALAKEFLKAGDNVIVCSRSGEHVELAVQQLRQEFGEQHVWGTVCDVREGKDVKALVAFASDKLNYIDIWGTVCDVREGKDVKALVAFASDKLNYIDIWINNAGSNAYSYKPLAETSDDVLMEIVTTNTLGLMICCREAINMMLNQPRGGHIFNIDGAGSDGRPTPRFAAYGATKRSVVHLTKSLQPGMVTTDLLMSGATTKQAKFFINILAEPPDVGGSAEKNPLNYQIFRKGHLFID
ncbi:putative chlorophyll(Ide) b reductase NOL, chloroplastic [Cocos nucifera]|uniref:Putative chlorophyll(Ide) b reductase NOL, chloroplastic n=1 Tax=Cocos nucifera TaxID=13894 RepID=A0A8K0N4B5_COCNU|nr:putative chlorophyll(Ide) b reductase NOL, chloroplastic [Cocos nucifera]